MSKLTNIIAYILIIIVTGTCNTSKQMPTGKTGLTRRYDSVLVDKDGNRYIVKILRDNKLWMTTNMELNIPGSYCYDNAEANCEKYGRLYTWEAAQKGCSLLGEGWRLPAKDDWQRLADLYGAAGKDSTETRKIAFRELLFSGSALFNALLGGGRDPEGEYARLEAHGFYWMATSNDNYTAWYANFAKGSQALYHQTEGEKERAFSVRCVRNMDSLK